MDLLTPRQCTPTTHTEAVHCQGVLLGGLPSLSLTTKGSWIHLLEEGRQAVDEFWWSCLERCGVWL